MSILRIVHAISGSIFFSDLVFSCSVPFTVSLVGLMQLNILWFNSVHCALDTKTDSLQQ